ncbi:cytidylyltransferase, putative [Campylobacter iguaniorum]|uniref:cytidylyltransferase domain-containing protein n=1 Tax=Campylobacter iguaniorum TaxID=1244531 RepID=UPI00073AB046|nr:spore coat biosynthesis protein F [Campylobacter iguaniorum]ALV23649.1 cytidylyltransferase, putative [Campylobacter iguaniorum]
MKVAAVIQARIGSTRLPYKMMLTLHDMPIIDWVMRRVCKSKNIDEVIVAIPSGKNDDVLFKHISKSNLKVRIFRGNQNNVLNRFYEATKNKDITHIVRVCADNPLIDWQEIDNLIDFYKNNSCDYAYNHIPKNNLYADGFGAEIISFNLLENLNRTVILDRHKEHLTSYIWDNSDKFLIKTFDPIDKELRHPELRFDIDTFEDYYKLAMKDFNIFDTSKTLINIFKDNK